MMYMKIDKYFIKRAYSNNRFREVRAKVNKFLIKESDLMGEEMLIREGEQSNLPKLRILDAKKVVTP